MIPLFFANIAYTSNWWSSQAKQPMKGQNICHNKDWRTDHSPEYATD